MIQSCGKACCLLTLTQRTEGVCGGAVRMSTGEMAQNMNLYHHNPQDAPDFRGTNLFSIQVPLKRKTDRPLESMCTPRSQAMLKRSPWREKTLNNQPLNLQRCLNSCNILRNPPFAYSRLAFLCRNKAMEKAEDIISTTGFHSAHSFIYTFMHSLI